MCHSVSYINLTDLLNFDYEKTFDIAEIAEEDILLFRFEIKKSKKQLFHTRNGSEKTSLLN